MGLFLKLLGLIDLAAAALLFLANLDLPTRIVLTVAGLLAFKGIGFRGDPVSVFDIFLGCYLAFATLIQNIGPLSILFGIYLGFKGFYSFI